MRKLMLGGLVAGIALFFSMQPIEAQRAMVAADRGAGSSPMPVAVANFPATQAVSGTVGVTTFPQTITIAGSVAIDNLPIENGALKTSGLLVVVSQAPHIVGFTQATFLGSLGGLTLTRACSAEFPLGRVCEQSELFHSIPVPAVWPPQARVVVDPAGSAVCFGDASGRQESCSSSVPSPAACCGF